VDRSFSWFGDAAKIPINVNSYVMQTDTGTKFNGCMFPGFRCEVDKRCDLLGYYTASSGNSLLTFRDNLLAPFSRVYIATVTDSMIMYKALQIKTTQFYNILDRASLCKPI
jgi:hypothetical protein